MSEDIELVRGSGNIYADLGYPNPELLKLRSVLAAKIIGVLDDRSMTVRQAHELTGIAAADFSRIRNAKLARFTVDRLMNILGRLDQRVEIDVKVTPRAA